MPTISLTLKQVRQALSGDLGDSITGTADAGGSTTTLKDAKLTVYPNGHFKGSELTVHQSTPETRDVTDSTKSTGIVTVTEAMTDPSTFEYELHNLHSRGHRKADYDRAINAALQFAVDWTWTDLSKVAWAMENGAGGGGTAVLGLNRREYPMPSGFLYIYGLDFLSDWPIAVYGTGNLAAWRAMGDAAARARVGQGFKVYQDAYIGQIAVYMGKVGSPTDSVICVVETSSSSLPSGTSPLNGSASAVIAGSAIGARGAYQVFTFDPPMLISANTQYHLYVKRSGSNDASNYYLVGEGTNGLYGDGSMSLYNSGSTTWSAVSGSDAIFAVTPASTRWVELSRGDWDYLPGTADSIRIKRQYREGTPLRLRGGAPIAQMTAESDTCPVEPGWVMLFAKAFLAKNKAGKMSADRPEVSAREWLQMLGVQPPPQRQLYPGSERVY